MSWTTHWVDSWEKRFCPLPKASHIALTIHSIALFIREMEDEILLPFLACLDYENSGVAPTFTYISEYVCAPHSLVCIPVLITMVKIRQKRGSLKIISLDASSPQSQTTVPSNICSNSSVFSNIIYLCLKSLSKCHSSWQFSFCIVDSVK